MAASVSLRGITGRTIAYMRIGVYAYMRYINNRATGGSPLRFHQPELLFLLFLLTVLITAVRGNKKKLKVYSPQSTA